ncbi:MAG: AMP-binding protein [Candidatus Omnitrophota bacterium]
MIKNEDIKKFYQRLYDAIKNSGALAYRNFGETHSYPELFSNMLKINSALEGMKGEKIVMYADKSFLTYGAIFSILLSGNTWVPLSLEMPETRLLEIFKQVEPKLVFHNVCLPSLPKEYLKKRGIDTVDINQIIAGDKRRDFADISFDKDDVAYIMFTSGSTGVPKGVPMTHENYINFINNCMEILPFKKNEVFSDYHDFAFDISIFYLFCCPLTEGAFAPVINDSDKIVPLRFIQENKITVWSSVPSVISRIQSLNLGAGIKTDIKIMFLCGEPFKLKILDYCLNNMGIENVYNFYGLTETAVENFYHRCSPEDLIEYEPFGYVPIGRPLPGNEISVTQDKELLLNGCQITPGYLKGEGLEKFEMIDNTLWFHTGDIVEEHKGVYFCKGRLDSQVKLKGYRVELMDIEVHAKRFPGVDEAVCFVKEKGNKKALACAAKPKKGSELDAEELRGFIVKYLPHYMVPGKIFILEDMPVNRNGKIDRRKIKEIFENK